jgi:hypothetical protein
LTASRAEYIAERRADGISFAFIAAELGETPAAIRGAAQRAGLVKPKILPTRTHVVIGDTQVKKGVPTDHLGWIGQYIVDQFEGRDLAVVHVGDHWDMPSLSSYDKGKKEMEGRRYKQDIEAGNDGLIKLTAPIRKVRKSWPLLSLDILEGNHEARIYRAAEEDAQLDGVISTDDFNAKELGWTVHPFLKPVVLDGVHYAHYFYNPNTGRPLAGENLETRLKTIGHSFTMGHQQGVKYAIRPVGQTRHHGLVVGSTYLHDEKYLGPQSTAYWRGIVVCHQVEGGAYDAMFVSLDFLCRKYEGKTLEKFLARRS